MLSATPFFAVSLQISNDIWRECRGRSIFHQVSFDIFSIFLYFFKDMKRHTLSVFVDDPLDTRADEDGYFTMPLF